MQKKDGDVDNKTPVVSENVENEIPNHNKYITTSEFNTFTSKIYDMKLKQANLAVNSDENAVL